MAEAATGAVIGLIEAVKVRSQLGIERKNTLRRKVIFRQLIITRILLSTLKPL